MKVVAIIPAFQEEARIGETIRSVAPYVDGLFVIDDGSADRTAEISQKVGVTVLRHRMNRGQGAALRTGTDAALIAGADLIVHIDADGQHDPASIPALLEPLREGRADVVFGSRFLGVTVGMPMTRRWLLAAARTFNALAVGVPRTVTDPQSGFRAMTAAAAAGIPFRQNRMAHCSEILRLVTRSEMRWLEIPVCVRYTEESLKKGQKPWDAFRIAWHLFLGALTK